MGGYGSGRRSVQPKVEECSSMETGSGARTVVRKPIELYNQERTDPSLDGKPPAVICWQRIVTKNRSTVVKSSLNYAKYYSTNVDSLRRMDKLIIY